MTTRVRQLEDQAVGLKQRPFSQSMNITCKQAVGETPSMYVFKRGLDTFLTGRATKGDKMHGSNTAETP